VNDIQISCPIYVLHFAHNSFNHLCLTPFCLFQKLVCKNENVDTKQASKEPDVPLRRLQRQII
jgi:hypothetical protein